MKISCVVKSFKTKDGKRSFVVGKAKGKYLIDSLPATQEDINYNLKISQKSGVAFPTVEGIYEIECEKIWLDKRPEILYPTVWISGKITFTKTHDLKVFEEKTK